MKNSKVIISLLAGVVVAFAALGVISTQTTNARTASFAERGFVENFFDGENDGTYNFDKAHSFINFKVKHYGLIEVPGFFRDFTGTVNYNSKDVTKSTVEFTAKTTSVDTGVAPRDKHLRTADFFDVEKFPDMTFKSTKIEKKGKKLMIFGDFTLRGVTKQISFPFQIAGFAKDARGTVKIGIIADTEINRRDYGVNYTGNLPDGTLGVADMIKVSLQIEAILQTPPVAK